MNRIKSITAAQLKISVQLLVAVENHSEQIKELNKKYGFTKVNS